MSSVVGKSSGVFGTLGHSSSKLKISSGRPTSALFPSSGGVRSVMLSMSGLGWRTIGDNRQPDGGCEKVEGILTDEPADSDAKSSSASPLMEWGDNGGGVLKGMVYGEASTKW